MGKNDIHDLLHQPRRRQLRHESLGGRETALVLFFTCLIVGGFALLLTTGGSQASEYEPMKVTPLPTSPSAAGR